MPSFVSGVAVIRGQPTPVLDARVLLGGADEAPPGRLVTLSLGARTAALAVDSVLGVRQLGHEMLASLPHVLSDPDNRHVAALTTLDQELLVVLQHAQLVPESLWPELARAEQPA